MPKTLVQKIFVNLRCEIFVGSTLVLDYHQSVTDICLIKQGFVKMFDQNYNFVSELQPNSFYGDYQVMLDLNAGSVYRACQESDKYSSCSSMQEQAVSSSILLKIPKSKFLKLILSHENFASFEHFNEMAVQRFIYFKKLK